MFTSDTLKGKVAIVTGAGIGIGVGIVEALVAAGAAVVVSYNQSAKGAEETAAKLTNAGGSVFVQQCDVQDYAQVQQLIATAVQQFGRLDIMINNSGITEPHPLLEMTPDEWDKTLNINLRGAFFCTQQAARQMIAQGEGGRIINLSSVHGFAAAPLHAHYEASKGGINLFTKACAIELAPHNIQVNAIAPGAIEVPRFFTFKNYDPNEWGDRVPAGRVGMPSDIGPLAVFLASPLASYITGQIIWVDGGMTSKLM